MAKLSFSDRVACALLGAVFGALYSCLIAVVVAWFTDGHFRSEYLWFGVGVFGATGFFTGPFVGDIIGDLSHVVYGFFSGIVGGPIVAVDQESTGSRWLRSLFLLGFGTGLVLYLVWFTSGH